ncbi:MAG: isomerase [Hyphomicrobiales bacterium]|nr:MAG: isomerase [Hyphomicrobiales bacterium]
MTSTRVNIHPLSDVQSSSLGENVSIWQYCVVMPGARIGSRVTIGSHCVIENDVVIGDNVVVRNGVQLWDGLRLEDEVFIGPNVAFTNDRFPVSGVRTKPLTTVVRRGASIGANATILPGVEIGERAMIGAGAVVTGSIPAYAIVVGNPASIIGYTHTDHRRDTVSHVSEGRRREPTAVPGVDIYNMPVIADIRGKLTVGEFARDIPFTPERYFMVYDVPSRETRGEHAHRACHQLLICVRGSCVAIADDGKTRQEFVLDRCDRALHMPPMIWGTQYRYSADAMLLVFASHHYDPDDYIRDYAQFISEVSI